MRNLLLIVLAASWAVNLACGATWDQEYGRLLKRYVTRDGVRYAEWKANRADVGALEAVVQGIAAEKPAEKGKEALAYYLNAYNAWILHEALAKYPTRSVKDPLFTFFLGNRIRVAQEKMSFNRLEKEIIRQRFSDPRVHMALNCASRSCPPLRSEPYDGRKLDAQLDDQSREFVNLPKGVTLTRDGAALSAIFDWYQEDFAPAGGNIAFINRYRRTPIAKDSKITFQPYDWRLNEVK